MKKILLALIITGCLYSCKKTGVDANSSTSIVGTWQLNSEIVNTYTNGSVSNTATISVTGSFLTLNSNNTGSTTSNGKSSNLTYSVSGSNISLTAGSITTSGIIKNLTSNSLEIYRDYKSTTGQTFDDFYTK